MGKSTYGTISADTTTRFVDLSEQFDYTIIVNDDSTYSAYITFSASADKVTSRIGFELKPKEQLVWTVPHRYINYIATSAISMRYASGKY